jgi:hypothetical protein
VVLGYYRRRKVRIGLSLVRCEINGPGGEEAPEPAGMRYATGTVPADAGRLGPGRRRIDVQVGSRRECLRVRSGGDLACQWQRR